MESQSDITVNDKSRVEILPVGPIIIFIVGLLFCCIMPLYAATPWLHADGNVIKDPDGNVVVLRGVD
ncbi:MAG: hypothetical protein JW860_00105, partial [Sedimentisphaerales bacterium]|nr:hypothetical protein [Sedimentisphaerales bacterium]